MKKSILASISTRGRYDTTLPMAIQSVICQTLRPNKLVIFDDNETPKDLREVEVYRHLFNMLENTGIEWAVTFGKKKGQHHNHQTANMMGYEWVWRLDDDNIAEPDVLEKLYAQTAPDVGAVGGTVINLPYAPGSPATGKIENIYNEPNIQWDYVKQTQEVDHLYSSFLYRAGVQDYDLTLSRVAYREETLFTYGLKKRGYKILVTPTVTWHLRNSVGGIRDGEKILFDHDDWIFSMRDNTIVILDCGMGDHIVFKHIMKDIPNPVIYSCYPEIVPGKSIGEAQRMFGDIAPYNIYMRMDEWNWKGSLEDAFRKLYIGSRLK